MTRPNLRDAVDLRKRVARNLARLRAERGLTLKGLQRVSGLHWRHVQKIEVNEQNATLTTVARLARGLQVDPVRLFQALPSEGGRRARVS